MSITVIELIDLLENMPAEADVVLEIVDLQRDEGAMYDLLSAGFDPSLDVVVLRPQL